MEAKHTPGPWFAKREGFSTVYIEARLRAGVIQEVAACGPTEAGQDQQEANAEFIVRACNSHDQLVAAVKAQHSAIDTLMAHLIHLDPNFKPTKSIIWPAVVAGNEALTAAGAA